MRAEWPWRRGEDRAGTPGQPGLRGEAVIGQVSLLRFVWVRSWRSQIGILALSALIFPLTYATLELPKTIINDAIGGGPGPRQIGPFTLDQLSWLLVLAGALFLCVLTANLLKWRLNVWIGETGDRLLRSLRVGFLAQILRFPAARLKRERPGDLVQRLMGEVEPLGGFMGGVIATPVFEAGLLLIYAGFVFAQSVWLGLATIAMFPLQAWLVPLLQARIVELNRLRARRARETAEFVSETVEQIGETRVNGASGWRLSEGQGKLRAIGAVREALLRRKYFIKGVNNVLNQLSPVMFYALGGWLVIDGQLEIGSLVAVVAAQREMAGPWKALLTFVQHVYDFGSRFAFASQSFADAELVADERVFGPADAGPLAGPLVLEIQEAAPGADALSLARAEFAPGSRIAVLGGSDGAAGALMAAAAGLEVPLRGEVSLGGRALESANLAALGAAVGYVGQEPAILSRTLEENLLFGLLSTGRPGQAGDVRTLRDWIDPDAGPEAAEARTALLLDLADGAGLTPDLVRLALGCRLTEEQARLFRPALLSLRGSLQDTMAEAAYRDLVEPWRIGAVNAEASILENLLFCWPDREAADEAALLASPKIARALRRTGAERFLAEIGRELATAFREVVEAAGDGAALQGLEGWRHGDLLMAAELLQRPSRADRRAFAAIGARFVPARDPLIALDMAQTERLLDLRAALRAALDEPGVHFFDTDGVDPSQSLFDGLLGGRRRRSRRVAWDRIDDAVQGALRTEGLERAIATIGLGTRGFAEALSAVARQRIGLVRALAKGPRLLVLDHVFGRAEHARLRDWMMDAAPGAIILYAAVDEAAAEDADMVIRIEATGEAAAHPASGPRRTSG